MNAQDQQNIIDINTRLEDSYKSMAKIEKSIASKKEQGQPSDTIELELTQTKQLLTTLFIARAQHDKKVAIQQKKTDGIETSGTPEKLSDLDKAISDREKVDNLKEKKHKKLSDMIDSPLDAIKNLASESIGALFNTRESRERSQNRLSDLEEELEVAKITGDEKKTLKLQSKIKEKEDSLAEKSEKGSLMERAQDTVKSSALKFSGDTLDKVTDSLDQETRGQKMVLDKSVNMYKYVTLVSNAYTVDNINEQNDARNMVQNETLALMKMHNDIRKKYGYSSISKDDFISSLGNQYITDAFGVSDDVEQARANDKERQKTEEDSEKNPTPADKLKEKKQKETQEKKEEQYGMLGSLGASLGIKNSLNDNDYTADDSKKMIKLSESINENLEKIADQMVDEQDTSIDRKGKKDKKQKFDKNGKAIKDDEDTSIWDMIMAGLGLLATKLWKKIGPMVKKMFGKLLAPFKKMFRKFKIMVKKALRFAKRMINKVWKAVFGKNLLNSSKSMDMPEGPGKDKKNSQNDKKQSKRDRKRNRSQRRNNSSRRRGKGKGRGVMSGCGCMPDKKDKKNKKGNDKKKQQQQNSKDKQQKKSEANKKRMETEQKRKTKMSGDTKSTIKKGSTPKPKANHFKPKMAKSGFFKTAFKGVKGLGKSVFKIGGVLTAGLITGALLAVDAVEIRNATKNIFGPNYEKRVAVIAKSIAALGTSQASWLWGSSPEEDFVKYIITSEELSLEEFDKAMSYIEGNNDDFLKIIMVRREKFGASDPAVLQYGEEAMAIFGTSGTKLVKNAKTGIITSKKTTMRFEDKSKKATLDAVRKDASGDDIYEAMIDADIVNPNNTNDGIVYKKSRFREYITTYLDENQRAELINDIKYRVKDESLFANEGDKMIAIINGVTDNQNNLAEEDAKIKKSHSIMKQMSGRAVGTKEYKALSKDLTEKDRKKFIQKQFLKNGADDAIVRDSGTDFEDKATYSKQVALEDGSLAIYTKVMATSKSKLDKLSKLKNKNMEEFLAGLVKEGIVIVNNAGIWGAKPLVIKDLIEMRSIPLSQWSSLATYVERKTKIEGKRDSLSHQIAMFLKSRETERDNISGFTTFDNEGGANVMSNYSGRVEYTPKKVTYTDAGQVRTTDDMSLKELFINNGNNDIEGLDENVLHNLKGMAMEFKEITGRKMQVNSAFRSFEEQADMKKRKGKKAASPGKSMHNYGLAFDIQTVDANDAIKANLFRKYGFWRPIVASETWHVEPLGIDRKSIRDNGMKQYRKDGTAPAPVSGGVSIDSEGQTITKKDSKTFTEGTTKQPVSYETGAAANEAYQEMFKNSGLKATAFTKYEKKPDPAVVALVESHKQTRAEVKQNKTPQIQNTTSTTSAGATHNTSIKDAKLEKGA